MSEKYVSPNTGKNHQLVYHTNPECKVTSNLRPTTENEINHHGLTLCAYCDPDKDPTANDQDRSYYNALKRAANDE